MAEVEIDPAMVEAACMNDLSRIRQEELPLSNIPRKGPSFDPRGRNGTSHYSSDYKQGLSSKWTVNIVDDESRNIEGLRFENARPWGAQKAREILTREAAQLRGPIQRPMASTSFPVNPAFRVPARLAQNSKSPVAQSQVSGVQRNMVTKAAVPQDPTNVVLPKPPLPIIGFRNTQAKAASNSPDFLVADGLCEMLPSGSESSLFNADFKLVLHTDTNEASVTFVAIGKAARLHKVSEFESPEMNGDICMLTLLKNRARYYLRLSNNTETKKFQKIFRGLQQSMAIHQAGGKNGVAKTQNNTPAVDTSSTTAPPTPAPAPSPSPAIDMPLPDTPAVDAPAVDVSPVDAPVVQASAVQAPAVRTPAIDAPVAEIPTVETPVAEVFTVEAPAPDTPTLDTLTLDAPAVKSLAVGAIVGTPTPSIAPTEGTLIELDGFQEVENTEAPNFHNAADHIIRLIDKVVAQYNLNEHLIESVREGIEQGAVEYWIQHGFMRDYNDDMKEHLIAATRHMIQLSVKLHLRQISQGQGNELDENPYEQVLDPCGPEIEGTPVIPQLGRVKYSPEDMEKLKANASVPSDWSAAKGLPISGAAAARSALREIDATIRYINDGDIIMANTEDARRSATPAPSAAPTPKAQPPTKGLAASRWANAPTISNYVPIPPPPNNLNVSSAWSVGVNHNSAAPAARTPNAPSNSGTGVQGLSSSRYATKMTPFYGNFTVPE